MKGNMEVTIVTARSGGPKSIPLHTLSKSLYSKGCLIFRKIVTFNEYCFTAYNYEVSVSQQFCSGEKARPQVLALILHACHQSDLTDV